MGKARLLGAKSNFVPNSKADMRFRRKIYQHNREIAERDPYEIHECREMNRLKKWKEAGLHEAEV